MDSERPAWTNEKLIATYLANKLVETIFTYKTFGDDQFKASCELLHNSGAIDLLRLLQSDEFRSVSLHDFFAGQKFYCDVIPQLQAPVARMMESVIALVEKAGNDLASNLPRDAFRRWCENDLCRAREVIAGAHDDQDAAKDLLTTALIAGSYINDARGFIRNYSDTRRLSGIFAIGKINCPDGSEASNSLRLFSEVVSSEVDDLLYANVLQASFDLSSSSTGADADLLLCIVRIICAHPCPAVHDVSAKILLFHSKEIDTELFTLLADVLATLDAKQKGTLQSLDVALGQLLRGEEADRAIEFLQNYLLANSEHISLSDFASFQHALRAKPAKLQDVLLRWMLTGKPVLCESIRQLFSENEDGPYDFSVPIAHLSEVQQLFISRKVLGYMFTQPTIVCSFLVCVLRQCSDGVAEHLAELLFDPLLRSYGGKALKYLSSIAPDDRSFHRIAPALERASQYISEITSVGEIKELHPSENARHTAMMRDFDEMQSAHKEATSQSQLLSLVSRSVVLHGRRTLSFLQGPNDERTPMEMELHSHSFEFEMPRLDVLDPVGLDYALRRFRAEQFIV